MDSKSQKNKSNQENDSILDDESFNFLLEEDDEDMSSSQPESLIPPDLDDLSVPTSSLESRIESSDGAVYQDDFEGLGKDLDADLDLDLGLDEDFGVDEKINELLEDESLTPKKDFLEDDDDEPITLSLDELQNISGDAALETQSLEHTEEDGSDFSDKDLDDILGRDVFDEEEDSNLVSAKSSIINSVLDEEEDFSNEPITLSENELDTITGTFEEEDSDGLDDLDSDTLDFDALSPLNDLEEDEEFSDTDDLETDLGIADDEKKPSHDDEDADADITLPPSELDSILGDLGGTTEEAEEMDFSFTEKTTPAEDFSFEENAEETPMFGDDAESEVVDLTLDEKAESDFDPLALDPEKQEEEATSKIDWDANEEDESITLSLDELSNIVPAEDATEAEHEAEESAIEDASFDSLGSDLDFDSAAFGETEEKAEEESEDSLVSDSKVPAPDFFSEDAEEDEAITLSDDELGSILSSDSEMGSIADLQSSDSLSDEEDQIHDLDSLSATRDYQIEELSTDDIPNVDELGISPSESKFFEETTEEEEPIALSLEELENITGEAEVEEVASTDDTTQDWYDTPATNEEDLVNYDPFTEDLDAVESLSDTELDSILGDIESTDTLSERETLEPESSAAIVPAAQAAAGSSKLELSPGLSEETDPGILIDLDEYAEEGELSAIEELRGFQEGTSGDAKATPEKSPSSERIGPESLSGDERKKVITYIDELLGNLPDNVIEEFSKSSYFDLYKRLMKEIGL